MFPITIFLLDFFVVFVLTVTYPFWVLNQNKRVEVCFSTQEKKAAFFIIYKGTFRVTFPSRNDIAVDTTHSTNIIELPLS